VCQPLFDRVRFGELRVDVARVAVEQHDTRRAAPAPFAHDSPFAKLDRRHVDKVGPDDIPRRIRAGQKSHFREASLVQFLLQNQADN
jgi:hypothetical protein